MNNFINENTNTVHEVGEVVLIGTEEWTISEIVNGTYILYHEGVSGTSHTLELTKEELNEKIVEI